MILFLEILYSKEYFKKILKLTLENDLEVKYIDGRVDSSNIIFLIGIGNVWSIIIPNTILNNLHRIVEEQPLVMIFSVNYDGNSFMLFNTSKNDNY